MAARKPANCLLKSLRQGGALGGMPQRRSAHTKGYIVPQGQQAHPLCGFYESHLAYKPKFARVDPPENLPEPQSKTSSSPPPPPPPKPAAKKAEPLPKAAEPAAAAAKETKEAAAPAKPSTAAKKSTIPVKKTTSKKAGDPATAEAATVRNPSSSSSSSSSSSPSSSFQSPETSASPSSPSPSSSTATAITPSGPKIIFGSRLNASDPLARKERLESLRRSATRILGVLVPPRPEEPDNCCMSGCVNCVWDTFREEMELWADATREVEKRRLRSASADDGGGLDKSRDIRGQQGEEQEGDRTTAGQGIAELQRQSVGKLQRKGTGGLAASMDDDRGGSETDWDEMGNPMSKNLWDEELYKGVPVGIREFMKLEKKLKDAERAEGKGAG